MPDKPIFEEVPPWPDRQPQRDQRLDNNPPLEDRILLDFEDDLEAAGITARVRELIESAEKAPDKIEDDRTAGKVGDLVKMARAVEQRIEEAREKHNRPLINARSALKAKADGVFAGLGGKVVELRQRLNAYIAEQDRIRREEERRREAEAKRIREEQDRLAKEAEEAGRPAPEPAVEVVARPVAAPIARGDLGAKVAGRTVWKHEIEVPIAKLPKTILETAGVREAVDKAIAAQIRGGTREIRGVKIWSEQEAAVR
jgi:septal ring factor EnvC (AmiA/AmiB activator)